MSSAQHPLVVAYLAELSRMLGDLPAQERSEVLAGVREHIDRSLAARPGADVREVLAELGPPEAVAREAHGPGSYAVGSPPSIPPPVRPALSDRPWAPVVVAVLQVLSLLGLVILAAGTASYTAFESTDGVRVVDYSVGTALVGALFAALAVLPLWIGVALLVGNSRLWSGAQQLVHLLLLPVSALIVGAVPDLGWAIAGELGLNIASVAALVVTLVGGAWLVVRLTRVGRAAASS